MLKRVKGDLLKLAEEDNFAVIVHGCNCFHTMGGGIAKEISEKYPMAYAIDCAQTKYGDYSKLGSWTSFYTGKFVIINAYTQFDMSNGQDVFEYTAFQLILQKLVRLGNGTKFGFPYIGMGLAKGDATRIIGMLEKFAADIEAIGGSATLVEYDPSV